MLQACIICIITLIVWWAGILLLQLIIKRGQCHGYAQRSISRHNLAICTRLWNIWCFYNNVVVAKYWNRILLNLSPQQVWMKDFCLLFYVAPALTRPPRNYRVWAIQSSDWYYEQHPTTSGYVVEPSTVFNRVWPTHPINRLLCQ